MSSSRRNLYVTATLYVTIQHDTHYFMRYTTDPERFLCLPRLASSSGRTCHILSNQRTLLPCALISQTSAVNAAQRFFPATGCADSCDMRFSFATLSLLVPHTTSGNIFECGLGSVWMPDGWLDRRPRPHGLPDSRIDRARMHSSLRIFMVSLDASVLFSSHLSSQAYLHTILRIISCDVIAGRLLNNLAEGFSSQATLC